MGRKIVKARTEVEIERLKGSVLKAADLIKDIEKNIIDDYPESDKYPIDLDYEYCGYDGRIDWFVTFHRYETDEEMVDRIELTARQERAKAFKIEAELAEYKRLKEKFEHLV